MIGVLACWLTTQYANLLTNQLANHLIPQNPKLMKTNLTNFYEWTFDEERLPKIVLAFLVANLLATLIVIGSQRTSNSYQPTAISEQKAVSLQQSTISIKPIAESRTLVAENRQSPNSQNAKTPISQQALNYIKRYYPLAQSEQKKYGIPASIKLGQALLESEAGESPLVRKNNNHFGMKCFKENCAAGHCTNYGDDHHKDFFRKYNTTWESYRSHSLLLAKGRYKSLKQYGNDYEKWAYGLKQMGYATDKKYAQKLINIIKKYRLYEYDI